MARSDDHDRPRYDAIGKHQPPTNGGFFKHDDHVPKKKRAGHFIRDKEMEGELAQEIICLSAASFGLELCRGEYCIDAGSVIGTDSEDNQTTLVFVYWNIEQGHAHGFPVNRKWLEEDRHLNGRPIPLLRLADWNKDRWSISGGSK